MSELYNQLLKLEIDKLVNKQQLVEKIINSLTDSNYEVVEINDHKPWGAYFRLANSDAGLFAKEFFPGLDLTDIKLDNDKAELSPKILLVSPGQRLSWQYHNRRAESWSFLTDGAYIKSLDDEEGELRIVKAGEIVQFNAQERHRLIGHPSAYTLVAEIWQHTDSYNLSDEDDIVRLSDDYNRNI